MDRPEGHTHRGGARYRLDTPFRTKIPTKADAKGSTGTPATAGTMTADALGSSPMGSV